MEIVTFLKDVIIALTSILIAVFGYFAWRIQFVAKEKYSLSRRALLYVYNINEKISLVRKPFRYIDFSVLTNQIINGQNKKAQQAHMKMYVERWDQVWSEGLTKSLTELRTIACEIGVVVGSEPKQNLELLCEILNTLHSAKNDFFEAGNLLVSSVMSVEGIMPIEYEVGESFNKKINKNKEIERFKKFGAIIHSNVNGDDLKITMESLLNLIESSLKPYLKLNRYQLLTYK